jgi:cytidylate kinase
MSIVAISQTLGSLGDEIGRELARTLSWEFADREIIAQAAQRFGEGLMELEHVTEEKPSLWDRFTDTRRRYLTYVEAIVFEMAARDNVILSGRGATIFLRRVRHALRVRITAAERVRAYRVEHQHELTSEAALHRVKQNDRERASNVKFLYHVDWDDPLLYDLVLNTERMDVKEGARVLRNALENERVRPTPESRAEVKDLSLAAQAKAALLASRRTPVGV